MIMNTHSVKVAVILAFVTSLTGSTTFADHEVEVEGLSAIVRKHLAEGEEGAMALLVTRDQQVVHCKGYGSLDVNVPMTPQTRLSLASVAKQFTAMCAAILIDEGKLKPSDKVSQHLPDLKLPVEGRELLVQDLVWHISGLPNFTDRAERATSKQFREERGLKYFTNKTHAEWLATQPLRRPPGIQYQYTNSGYALLARVVEAASGQTYREFQQEQILDKLGMKNTEPVAAMNGAGNMETTLDDYLKWDRAIWNQTLLSDRTSQFIFSPGVLDNGQPVSYGFGWKVDPDRKNPRIVRHGGSGSLKGNARNMILRDLTNEITVAFFIRDNLKFSRTLRESIAAEFHEFVLNMGKVK